MGESAAETKAKIIESAKKEFLEKGFIGANLRTIAADAGVTTGAMYRHFKDKDALFCALVDEAIEVITKTVMMADVITHSQFAPPASQEHHKEEQKAVKDLLDYIYAHFDAFVLLLTKAAGSTHENILNEISRGDCIHASIFKDFFNFFTNLTLVFFLLVCNNK